jgi:asparagine synthase (glutamine-hydrolysing)
VAGAPKRGFNSPLASLLRTSLHDKAERVFVRDADVFEPFFSAEGIAALWREHVEMRADHAYALWPLLTFGSWRPCL